MITFMDKYFLCLFGFIHILYQTFFLTIIPTLV